MKVNTQSARYFLTRKVKFSIDLFTNLKLAFKLQPDNSISLSILTNQGE